MDLADLFSRYGHLILLFGSLGQGVPIMLFGGFAAHRGWLALIPWVILIGAIGNALVQGIAICRPQDSRKAFRLGRQCRTGRSIAQKTGSAGGYRRPVHSGLQHDGRHRRRALDDVDEEVLGPQCDRRICMGAGVGRPRFRSGTGRRKVPWRDRALREASRRRIAGRGAHLDCLASRGKSSVSRTQTRLGQGEKLTPLSASTGCGFLTIHCPMNRRA